MSQRFSTVAAACAAACVLLGAAAPAIAQKSDAAAGYPSRPVRIVVPFTPGGQPDIVARLIAQRLTESLGQQVIVDNRPGAGGMIGSRIVVSSNPDGHTLLSISGAHVVTPAVRANLGYDTIRDFAGITLVYNAAYYLVVPVSLEVRTVKDLVALAKAKPGQLNFTSAGTGSATHFGGELFKARAGIDVVHVPHRGIPEALTEVMTGRIHFFMAPFGSTAGLIRDGKLRALAVSSEQRTRMNPEIPTIAESGLPGFRYDSWGAMFAPAKTPRPIIDKLNRVVAAALKQPDVVQRLHGIGMEPAPTTPAQVDRFAREQLKVSLDLARRAGLKPE
ncbi:MAG TPA: tripartite tricarboxylate transporter substrate binding protein [Burkholderiales bacterium]|nr:tripartite tricarboxylate transporter substrate binding protein [Burkholderiales bacterium]